MKLIKLLLNAVYYVATIVFLAFIFWGINAFANIGGSKANVPNLIKNKKDPINTVYFTDLLTFFGTTVSQAAKDHEIYIDTKGDGSEYLWFIPMSWANKSLTVVKNIGVAIFSPSFEVTQVEKYRKAVLIQDGEGRITAIRFNDGKTVEAVLTETKSIKYKTWANEKAKYDKYNSKAYDGYMNLVTNKGAVVFAYTEILAILIVGLVIVCNMPIDVEKNEESGSYKVRPRTPWGRKRKQKKEKEGK